MSDATNSQLANYPVRVRFVETFYRNRLGWEEGPGSAQVILSDVNTRIKGLGRHTLADAEELTRDDLERYFNCYFEEDSADGFEEYSYKLEYFDPAARKWRFLKNFM